MIKKFDKFLKEDYEGLFDKIKGSKNKIESVLKTHGYNSSEEFIRDVDKINGYTDILHTDVCSKDVTIENILSVYQYKQKYEDLFSVIDELNNLLLEIKDEGLQIAIRYHEKYGKSEYSGYQGYSGSYITGPQGHKPAGYKRRNFSIQISSNKEMGVSTLYLVFGVLMETEGRGEISFKVEGVSSSTISLTSFIDDEPVAAPKKKKINNEDQLRDYLRQIATQRDVFGGYEDYENAMGEVERRRRETPF